MPKKSKEVHNKKKKKDIIIRMDDINIGRIPTAKGTKVIHGKKNDNKFNRKKSKLNLKKYIR